MKVYTVDDSVKNVKLTNMVPYAAWHYYIQYFVLGPGKEHYPLLAHMASQCEPGDLIVDMGTHVGMSALALASNEKVQVISYDLIDLIDTKEPSAKTCPNIELRIMNCKNDVATLLRAKIILMDVDPHDGIQEKEYIELLIRHGYKGIVLCDDIYLDAMKPFWEWVPLKKIDLSHYGHWSGTGAIIFDPSVADLHVTPLQN